MYDGEVTWNEQFEHDWHLICACTSFNDHLRETVQQTREQLNLLQQQLRPFSSFASESRTDASDQESIGEIASLISNADLEFDAQSSTPHGMEDDESFEGKSFISITGSNPASTANSPMSALKYLNSLAPVVKSHYKTLSKIYDFFSTIVSSVRHWQLRYYSVMLNI